MASTSQGLSAVSTVLCGDPSEAIQLSEKYRLYLKPVAKLNISVTLPQMKIPGKAISNWEVMEKLRFLVKPDEFTMLKVVKSNLEFLRFEAEVETKAKGRSCLARLGSQTLKLSGFSHVLKIRAADAKPDFPTRHDWDSFFRDEKNMNEKRPGERPDTIHFQNLPSRWFAGKERIDDADKPRESVIRDILEQFGEIRRVDVPMLDAYRRENNRKAGIGQFSAGNQLTFDAFVQYKEYIGFVKAMDELRGMKLMYKDENDKAYVAIVKVDFDRTMHLTDRSVRLRAAERRKMIALEKKREEKVRKEREKEELRKEEERMKIETKLQEKRTKLIAKQKLRDTRRKTREEQRRREKEKRKHQLKLAKEERRMLIAQRKLEAIRLLKELIRRAEEIKRKEAVQMKMQELQDEKFQQLQKERAKQEQQSRKLAAEEKRKQLMLERKEIVLRNKIKKRFIKHQELEMELKREQLRKKVSGSASGKLKSFAIPSSSVKQLPQRPNRPKLKSTVFSI